LVFELINYTRIILVLLLWKVYSVVEIKINMGGTFYKMTYVTDICTDVVWGVGHRHGNVFVISAFKIE